MIKWTALPAAPRPVPLLLDRIRIVAAAATAAAAAVGLSALPAGAADNRPADPGVRCAAKLGPGEYEFYLPGAKVTDKEGNKWVCGPDGQWFKDYSAIIVSPTFMPPKIRAAMITQTFATTALR